MGLATEQRDGTLKYGDKEYQQYARLLAKAHEKGLIGIVTAVVKIPERFGDLAIFHAYARFASETGEIREFHGTGDATPENVGRMTAPRYVAMAETRAKRRALADALGDADLLDDEAAEGYAPHPMDSTHSAEGRGAQALGEIPPLPKGEYEDGVARDWTRYVGYALEDGMTIQPVTTAQQALGQLAYLKRKYARRA